jgi:hypothetical protein
VHRGAFVLPTAADSNGDSNSKTTSAPARPWRQHPRQPGWQTSGDTQSGPRRAISQGRGPGHPFPGDLVFPPASPVTSASRAL